jgi:asparagine synthase (glutamine-hydrolysing)
MCGIVFFSKNFNFSIHQALKEINHRGPDRNNFYENDIFYLGHALLQIRGELEESIQPVHTSCGRYVFAFNGQIYNIKNIIKFYDLKIHSDLDTRVISELIASKGIDSLNCLDGMYSLLIYDKITRKIYFLRDPSGQKNLYYYYKDRSLIICSEIQPIISILGKKISLSYEGLVSAIKLGYVANNSTLYKDIQKLLPGEIIEISLKTWEVTKSSFIKKNNLIIRSQGLKEIIQGCISNHLPSKKKIALNLSGGIDSNIILYEILSLGRSIDIFSTFFTDSNSMINQDYYDAKKIANHSGLKFFTTEISENNFFENFIKTYEIIEEPNRNFNHPAYYINFMNQKSMGYRSIISGLGGDEVFIGYDRYFNLNYKEKIFNFLSKNMHININKILIRYLVNHHKKYQPPEDFLGNELKNCNYDLVLDINEKFSQFKNSYFFEKKYLSVNFLRLIFDQYSWLANESFIAIDKLSMSNSLELRAPFASQNLRYQLLGGIEEKDFNSKINKMKIRDLYKDKLFPKILENKKKLGWSVPKEWYSSKKFKSLFLDIIPRKNTELFLWGDIRNKIEKDSIDLSSRYFTVLFSILVLLKKNLPNELT